MKARSTIERLVYALVILLSLAALWLLANAPADFSTVHAVYQGF
jgi:hypothetical protein